MGDQVGEAVTGRLYYVPVAEFRRVRALPTDATRRAEQFADLCRLNALYMIANAGSGHIGSSFSSLDIVSWLLLNELAPTTATQGNLYFSSKGHDAPGYYAALLGMEQLDAQLLNRLRRIDGLPGHPDIRTPNIVTNTGSLGMGISKAKGIALANRLTSQYHKIFVLTGDGELQEGQIWESLASAVHHNMDELVVIVDHNKMQSDTLVSKVSDLGDLEAKFTSFGWHVQRCDGNNIQAFANAVDDAHKTTGLPSIIVADTIKGCGVSFMEHTAINSDIENYKFHSGAPDAANYQLAVQELIERINQRFKKLGTNKLELETIDQQSATLPTSSDRLIGAYTDTLLKLSATHDNLVTLDADLILDTGLIPFSEQYPSRFIECGIAEQDMVSQAGGMALQGRLPIVHSFACFLSTRPNEQIYNNSTEGSKIIYVGSLAGLLPAGPGHSHQSVRDISTLAAMPSMELIQPCCEAEVDLALRYCVEQTNNPCYLRLVSIPVVLPYQLPADYSFSPGRGTVLGIGTDVAMIAYGPVMLSQAMGARDLLRPMGISLKVINLPWLNQLDTQWLSTEIAGLQQLYTLDDHYIIGGQGQFVAAQMAAFADTPPIHLLGVSEVPRCGTNEEVLAYHELDAASLAAKIKKWLA